MKALKSWFLLHHFALDSENGCICLTYLLRWNLPGKTTFTIASHHMGKYENTYKGRESVIYSLAEHDISRFKLLDEEISGFRLSQLTVFPFTFAVLSSRKHPQPLHSLTSRHGPWLRLRGHRPAYYSLRFSCRESRVPTPRKALMSGLPFESDAPDAWANTMHTFGYTVCVMKIWH